MGAEKYKTPLKRTGEELGSSGSIPTGGLGHERGLFTMEGRFQRSNRDEWGGGFLRGLRRSKKVRENN